MPQFRWIKQETQKASWQSQKNLTSRIQVIEHLIKQIHSWIVGWKDDSMDLMYYVVLNKQLYQMFTFYNFNSKIHRIVMSVQYASWEWIYKRFGKIKKLKKIRDKKNKTFFKFVKLSK